MCRETPFLSGCAATFGRDFSMHFSDETNTLLQAIESTAGKRLSRRNDLAVLIECAHRAENFDKLDELSFLAKFSHRTFAIMQRIGHDAEGYDKLAKEFGDSVEKSKSLIGELMEAADVETRKDFESAFFALSPDVFRDLLDLFYTLSWYKNYLIDARKG